MDTGRPVPPPRLTCCECDRVSVTGEGWAAFIAQDPADEVPVGIVVVCPSCAEREFGYEPRRTRRQ